MNNLRVPWFLPCCIVSLLVAFCPTAQAQWFSEDPNQCGPGQLWYRIVFDANGQFVEGQGWGYGSGWYYYPNSGTYRQWYYRGPYNPSVSGAMTISAGIETLDPNRTGWAQINFIWATPSWSTRGLDHPPLPDDVPQVADEYLCIGTYSMVTIAPSRFGSGEPIRSYVMPGYSSDWVGIEVAGGNIKAMRYVAPQYLEDGVYDYGDAPDSYGTSLASGGARHLLVRDVYLGQGVDSESDARPGSGADGDDDFGDQDEDGVVFVQPLTVGGDAAIDVTASTAGFLNVWFDFDRDGTFNGANEQVFTNYSLSAGVNHLAVTIPAEAVSGWTYARFRFTLAGTWIGPKGDAPNGEVEDYRVYLTSLSDDFDDNVMGPQWRLEQEDAGTVWLEEINDRLELRSTSSAAGAKAQYVSNGWGLDTSGDFTVRVDYEYAPVAQPQGYLMVRLSPAGSSGDLSHVDFKVGCDNSTARFYDDVTDAGGVIEQDSTARTASSGHLYVSYDADLDELYLSSTAAGEESAWKTISGLLKGRWGGATLSVGLGGAANGLALGAGQAWLDNFTIDTGPLAGPATVYRFWSPKVSMHFYTIKESEKTKLLGQTAVWTYEGPAYRAFPAASHAGTVPVYRFWAPKTGEHFFTIKESEKTKLLGQPAVWTYEDIAFYAFATAGQSGTVPLYRFWSPKSGAHFYTIRESEKTKLLGQPTIWIYEDIAWYVYAPAD